MNSDFIARINILRNQVTMIQILLCKILHFVGGTGRMMRIHKLSENG
jgi:hypothetical protein